MIRNVSVILLYNDKNQILFQHRDKEVNRLPDYWAFFGGGINKDETPEQAVRRETKEELNYELKNPKLVLTQEFKGKNHDGIKYIFTEKYNPSKKLTLNEGAGMEWLSCDEFQKRKISDHDMDAINIIKDQFS